jgi:hypothetical protein
MKRVGLRNKIISRYWNGESPEQIKSNVGCTSATVVKWLRPLYPLLHNEIPQNLLSLGWTAGELIKVLKIDESELKNQYGIEFKAKGVKAVTDDELIDLVDAENTPEEIAEQTDQKVTYIRNRLREIGWVKPKQW